MTVGYCVKVIIFSHPHCPITIAKVTAVNANIFIQVVAGMTLTVSVAMRYLAFSCAASCCVLSENAVQQGFNQHNILNSIFVLAVVTSWFCYVLTASFLLLHVLFV
jgi:hypothetical protein